MKKSTKQHKKVLAYQRAWYRKHREQSLAHKRTWRKAHPEQMRQIYKNAGYKKRHGITLAQFEATVAFQNNKCQICQRTMGLVQDHDHKTGLLRAALCPLCNTGLGYFQDNITFLKAAAQYLRTYEKTKDK